MTDIIKGILARRSVRSFEADKVEEDALTKILEAARWAPSWANSQCWEIVVVRDPEIKSAIQATLPEANPGHKAVAAAPVLLVLCAKSGKAGFYHGATCTKFGDWMLFDTALAAQNIALAAHSLGLATVVLGLFDQEAARAAVQAPEDCEVICLMPLGHPSQSPPPPPRRSLEESCHQDHF